LQSDSRLTDVLPQVQAAAGTSDAFVTAKGTQGVWRIAWSFFASAMGSWVITAPANFAVFAGWVGLISYAIASGYTISCAPTQKKDSRNFVTCAGLPLILISLFGQLVLDRFPDCCSLGDFIAWR
jgi:hypothetical protein